MPRKRKPKPFRAVTAVKEQTEKAQTNVREIVGRRLEFAPRTAQFNRTLVKSCSHRASRCQIVDRTHQPGPGHHITTAPSPKRPVRCGGQHHGGTVGKITARDTSCCA